MAVRIVCAKADMPAARSLAKFLKKQNIPTYVGYVSGSGQFTNVSDQLVLWSSRLAPFKKRLKDLPNSMLILLDDFAVPPELSGLYFVNAKGAGERLNNSWRAVSRLLHRDVSNKYSGLVIDKNDLPKPSSVELGNDVEMGFSEVIGVDLPNLELAPHNSEVTPDVEPSIPTEISSKEIEAPEADRLNEETNSATETGQHQSGQQKEDGSPLPEEGQDDSKIRGATVGKITGKDVLEPVPEFSDLSTVQQTAMDIPKRKTFLLPIMVLVCVIIGLGAAVGLLHPNSPYYGFLSSPEASAE